MSSSIAITQGSTAGSMSPQRVPMSSPSSGVKPIDVSTERPRSMAATEQPLPRWQVTSLDLLERPAEQACAARMATKRCEVPWKP